MSYNPEYYQTHKEIYRAANLRWRAKMADQPGYKERRAQAERRYYAQNREHIAAQRKKTAELRKAENAERGMLLRECRKAAAVSVAELADRLGVSKQYVSQMERGECNVRTRWALDGVLAVASKRLDAAMSCANRVSEVEA